MAGNTIPAVTVPARPEITFDRVRVLSLNVSQNGGVGTPVKATYRLARFAIRDGVVHNGGPALVIAGEKTLSMDAIGADADLVAAIEKITAVCIGDALEKGSA